MKLSIAIQAHPKRKLWAETLGEELGCPIAWDTDNTVWNTRKKALRLADKDSDWHLVIQDDAIICKNFISRAKQFIEKMEKTMEEPFAVQFYFQQRPTDKRGELKEGMKNGYMVRKFLKNGVAIATPTTWIKDLIKFGDKYYAWQDDTKMKHFFASKGYPTVYPLPCLVDHRRKHFNPSIVSSFDTDRWSPFFIDGKQEPPEGEIPPIIHQIWIGDPKLMPKDLMKTWQIFGWDYKLWTEKEIDELGLENRKLYDYFYKKKCYYGCSDIVRLEVLRKYGGIYIDADTERLLPIDELLKDTTFFSVWSNKKERIANGIIGAKANHPIIENYIKEMGQAKVIEPVWSTIGGTLFTKVIYDYRNEKPNDKQCRILMPHTFYPFDSKGKPSSTRGKTYAKHYWLSTHRGYGK